jgi:hypothetical protein|nr:MAG TPA: hypothetical protein [Caudoviricetes sp.]
MATNVTEKDKTLQEVIDFLEKEWDAANNASDNPDEEVLKYDFYDGMTTAYEHVINYCRHLLGYSGTMYSLEQLEHECRKAWREGYAAGWKDQECDFPPHTSENPYKETIE